MFQVNNIGHQKAVVILFVATILLRSCSVTAAFTNMFHHRRRTPSKGYTIPAVFDIFLPKIMYQQKSKKLVATTNMEAATSDNADMDETLATSKSSGEEEKTEEEPKEKEYAALSDNEIRKTLDTVPVYAVTGTNQEGLVLVAEKDNDNQIAYFFLSAELASSSFAPLLQAKMAAGEQVSWGLGTFTLGFVWYDVLKNPTNGIDNVVYDNVEYRLVQAPQELAMARSIYEAKQQMNEEEADEEYFKRNYNQIPIFLDRKLKVQAGDDGDNDSDSNNNGDDNKNMQMPMYFGLQDLVKTIQNAADPSKYQYNSEINVDDLHSVIQQMKEVSTIDFRNVRLIPPITPLKSVEKQSSGEQEEESNDDGEAVSRK